MSARQSWRSPELVRRSHCCGAEAWVRNAKLWCSSCGQQLYRASDVWGTFARTPPSDPPVVTIPERPRRRRGPIPGQGELL